MFFLFCGKSSRTAKTGALFLSCNSPNRVLDCALTVGIDCGILPLADDETRGVSDVWSRGVALLPCGTWLPTSAKGAVLLVVSDVEEKALAFSAAARLLFYTLFVSPSHDVFLLRR